MPRWKVNGSSATTEPEETEEEAPRAPRVRVLSAREADKLKGDLASLIQDAGDYLDAGLGYVNANGAKSDIWAFDDEEAEKLAEVWLSRGRKSAAAAQSIRYVLSQWAYVQVAVMLGGRFVETVAFVADNGGLTAPGFMRDRAMFGRRNPATQRPGARAAADTLAGMRVPASGSASSAAASSSAAPAQATPATPPADPRAAAEEAQRAHAARVAALRDGAGTAAEALADTMPASAPGAALAPELAPDLAAEEVGA